MASSSEDLQATIDEAVRALGPAWMHGGVSLAEASSVFRDAEDLFNALRDEAARDTGHAGGGEHG